MPDKRLKSKLEPYHLEIFYLRYKQHYTYSEIIEYLNKRHGFKTSINALANFLRVRNRRSIVPSEFNKPIVQEISTPVPELKKEKATSIEEIFKIINN